MDDVLTKEEKNVIINSFFDGNSWIDEESMDGTIIDELNYDIAAKHLIPEDADTTNLFWNAEPIATESFNALEELRKKYAERMKNAFENGDVKTSDQLETFEQKEQADFKKDWQHAANNFSWDKVQDNTINTLIDEIAPEFPNIDANELRQILINVFPACSAYDVSTDDVIDKVNDKLSERN